MTDRFLGMILIAFCAFVPVAIEAANLHSIIVADTSDEGIGSSTAIDYERMHREVQKIAHYTGLKLKEVTLKGNEARPKKLLERIRKLKVHSDDVVIFYFSGHGFRTPGKEGSPWPNLYFSREQNAVDFDLIREKLEEHNPRFILLIADACNSLIPDEWAPVIVQKWFFKAIDDEILKENYRHLFLYETGVVMVTSSEAGEPSWATMSGGLYTMAFIQSLNQCVKSSETPSWQNILDKSVLIVGDNQHPDYHIYRGIDNNLRFATMSP
ncbi:MAG: hypothetical protein K940chlam7_02003 [Chlamydiae bacterium]|nr:hypothetical protein [Chlamydiota bacterium]